jgi:hypothetical protein
MLKTYTIKIKNERKPRKFLAKDQAIAVAIAKKIKEEAKK